MTKTPVTTPTYVWCSACRRYHRAKECRELRIADAFTPPDPFSVKA